MHFIDILQKRGSIHQMTDEAGLRALLTTPGQTAYIGFDCTAKSLHEVLRRRASSTSTMVGLSRGGLDEDAKTPPQRC